MKEDKVLTKEEYKKRIKRCERLGAKQFAKVVKKVEKHKFKLLQKIYPNYTNKINSMFDKREAKLLKRCKTEEERKRVREEISLQKMLNKREDNYEMNRNYHVFRHRFSELINYLNYNKAVHMRGMLIDSIALPVLTALSFVNPIFIPLVGLDLVSLAINFECVNLQNYNIYRFEKNKDIIMKKEQKAIQNTQAHYTEGVKIINKVIDSEEKTMSANDRLKEIESNKEELIKLKELILKEKERRTSTRKAMTEKVHTKKLGGVS